MRIRRLVGAAVLALAAACRPQPQADPAAEERAIRDIAARQNGFFAARDTLAVGALYAPDAVLMPAGRPRVFGPDSIRHSFAASAEWNTGLRVTPVRIYVARSGELAVEDGDWEWRGRTQQGETREMGKHIVVWVKREGTWKMFRDIFNGDGPAAPPTTPPSPAPAGTTNR